MIYTLLDNSAFHTSSAPDVLTFICIIYPTLVFREMGMHDLVKISFYGYVFGEWCDLQLHL